MSDIDDLLRSNPKAARHAGSIRQTLGALRELRDIGAAGDGKMPSTPKKGRPSVRDAPKPSNRQPIKRASKLTILPDAQA